MRYCRWLLELSDSERDLFGNEFVDLAEAARGGASVVPGFVVGKTVFGEFFGQPKLRIKVEDACREVAVGTPAGVHKAAAKVRELIVKSQYPPKLAEALRLFTQDFQDRLVHPRGRKVKLVAEALGLRVEADIKKPEEILDLISKLYAQLFEDKELYLRLANEKVLLPEPIAVLIRLSDQISHSGIAYLGDTKTYDDNTIEIRASHFKYQFDNSLLEDIYRVDKKSLQVLSRELTEQWWAEDSGKHVSPAHLGKAKEVMADEEIIKLARQIRMASTRFEDRRVFFWEYFRHQFHITEVLPYGVLEDGEDVEETRLPLVHGYGACFGVVSGTVRVIKKTSKLEPGEIAVLKKYCPDDFKHLINAGAIVCETGTPVGVLAKLARELQIPAIVGAADATKMLKNGQTVTVDGVHGRVFAGTYQPVLHKNDSKIPKRPITGTRVLAIVQDPTQLEGAKDSDGIGLYRSEFVTKLVGVHPEDIIRKGHSDEYADILSDALIQASKAVSPRSVLAQLHDLTPDDLHGFRPRAFDRYEPNPIIGYRGTHRLLKQPELLEPEILAYHRARAKGADNIGLVLPMPRSVEEVEEALQILSQTLELAETEIWIKCETPGLLIRMDELVKLPIDGVIFNVTTLAQLITGTDATNYQVGHTVNQADSAVMQALSYAIEVCESSGITTTILADGEDLRPEVIEMAVQSGVTAVAVNPNRLNETRYLISHIESKALKEALLR